MNEHKVSVQSLIDHIKTATDVDPWAKEMAEELLKKQEPKIAQSIRNYWWNAPDCEKQGFCPKCHQRLVWTLNREFCGFCGQKVKWE